MHEIVVYRRQHGLFHSLDDLKNVPGIEPDLVTKVRAFVSAEDWHP